MDHTIIVNDYRLMDKLIKEERQYLIGMLKKIKKSGCNLLLIQKSILRDAVTSESLAILSKLKIAVIKDIERDEIDFLSRSIGCRPVADVDAFDETKLGYAELAEESLVQEVKVVKITGVKPASPAASVSGAPSSTTSIANSGGTTGARGGTVSILAMGGNQLVLDETERSLHDALCVVRCLVKKRRVILRSEPSHPKYLKGFILLSEVLT
jgi:T-complex protein 1 subunit delta